MSISRNMTRPALQAVISARRAYRRISAPSNLGLIVVITLCGLTAVSFALGFALRPSESAPAKVPDPPTLSLSFRSENPLRLSIYSFLEQASTRLTKLVVTATGTFVSDQTITRWTMAVLGFSGYLCPKQTSVASFIHLKGFPHDYAIINSSRIPAINGQPFLQISLCWENNAPLITNGSYISAALSRILVAPGQSGTVTRGLVLSGTSLSGYSLAGGIAPTEVTGRTWLWTDELSSSFQSQARAEIPIIATSLPGIQRDNRDIFYSGIFFGIAGGAAVSVIPALLDASDRRKKQHKADASLPHPAASSASAEGWRGN
jgi:hypothetical protein